MKTLTRKDFLKISGIGLGAVGMTVLTGCGSSSSSASSSATESTDSTSTESTQSASEETGASEADTTGGSAEKMSALEELAESIGGVSIFDLMDTSIIDTSRKSTYNTDETIPELTAYSPAEVTTWTPWQSAEGRSTLLRVVYEPLFYSDYNLEMIPCLAKDWYDEDDTHMVVEIYDYIHDSDGNNITADDVVASFVTYVESGNAKEYDYFESAEAIEDYKVRFTWTDKIDSITALSTMMGTLIYSQQAAADHDFTTDPVGTGAYALTELVTGTKYVLTPTDYWQTDESVRVEESKQNVDVFTQEVINDSNVAYISFEEGSVYHISLSTVQLEDFKEGGKHYGEYTLSYQNNTGVYGLGFNMSGESVVSDDLNLRLAIAYAIDSEGIVDAIGSDTHAVAYAEGAPSMGGYQDVWDTMENYYTVYDVDLAKEYLEQSNYNGETLHIIMKSGREANDTAVQIIQQELAVIGIDVSIDAYENAIMNSYLYDVTNWDMYFYINQGDPVTKIWANMEDLDNFTHGYTATGANDPVLQEMIDNVQTVDGYTDENIQAVQQYFTDNCMLYSIWSNLSWNAYEPNIARIVSLIGHDSIFYTACEFYLD